MEILSTHEYVGYYYFIVIFLGAISLILISTMAFAIYDIVKERDFSFNSIGAFLFITSLTTLFSFGFYSAINDEPPVDYRAIVTDFNEVYNNGYKIIDKEGQLYILEKDKGE